MSVFADTHLLLYAASGCPDDSVKSTCARQILREKDIVISFQVLQEFYANALNPRKLGLTHSQTLAYCQAWLTFPVVPLTADTFVQTLELATRYRISHWDAAIVAAAQQAGCGLLYSEDLNHGQDYAGIRLENPFRGL
ncbi:MAG: PIN domain-containing protein [Gammaproteobacteria bacterium]|nr:PIN domain-containing protein [Gammaproteobacteria bacterium]